MGPPGKSFIQMYKLIREHRVPCAIRLEKMFTVELLLAICWEETFFNNRYQYGSGTAVGFGQTEPSEFDKLATDKAKEKGYAVDKLPARVRANGKVASSSPLTDQQSIQVQSALLCHAHLSFPHAPRRALLEVYGGVPFSWALEKKVAAGTMTAADARKIDPLGPVKRMQLIDGWEACETKLLAEFEFGYVEASSRETVRSALFKAKWYPTESSTWDRILFPESEKSWWAD